MFHRGISVNCIPYVLANHSGEELAYYVKTGMYVTTMCQIKSDQTAFFGVGG